MTGPRTRSRPQRPSFQCQVCHKVYSKAEHLQRHERSHTGSKPFTCPTCGRHFSRADSLSRHERIHKRATARHEETLPIETPGYSGLQHPFCETNSTCRDGVDEPSLLANYTFPEPGLSDFNLALEWPDAEALLHSIVSSDWDSLALPPGSMPLVQSQPHLSPVYEPEPVDAVPAEHSGQLSPPNGSHEAIQSLSEMVTSFSRNVTSAVEALPGLSSVFLDNCLQAYFAYFNDHFPILHRPTFVFRDCSPSLILNAIALGSLYIGTPDAISKGEVLWRLAHTAIATSWQVLIRHQGLYDSHRGVQLVLTALLGQCYAMMSKNENIRLISQVFHSLGFNWANQCDMFVRPPLDVPLPSDRHNDEDRKWRMWASREVLHRALLGHYILDGQLAYLSGQCTSIAHATNCLGLSASTRTFEARSVGEWQEAFNEQGSQKFSFRKFYKSLFSEQGFGVEADMCLQRVRTPLDVRVILECLHVLVRENRASNFSESIVSIPSLAQIKEALMRVRELLNKIWPLDRIEALELMLRWHFICIDTLCDTIHVADQICRHCGIDQHIFKGLNRDTDFDGTLRWVSESADAKRAFLHATAVQDIVGQLPMNRTYSFWMPVPLFAVSIICTLFRLTGVSSISVPSSINWRLTLIADQSCTRHDQLGEDEAWRKTRSFLMSDSRTSNYGLGPLRNLPFDFKRIQLVLHSLALQWGICSEMEDILSKFEVTIK